MRCQVPGRIARRWTLRFQTHGVARPCCHCSCCCCCCINKYCWHPAFSLAVYFYFQGLHSMHGRALLSFTCPACHANAPPISVSYGRGWRMINIQLHGRSSSRSRKRKTMHATAAPRKSVLHFVCHRWKNFANCPHQGKKKKSKQNNVMNARNKPESISSNCTFDAVFFSIFFFLLFSLLFVRQRVPPFDLIMLVLNGGSRP